MMDSHSSQAEKKQNQENIESKWKDSDHTLYDT